MKKSRFRQAEAGVAGEATRLREIAGENAKLKKLLTEAHLHIEALKVGFEVRWLRGTALVPQSRREGARKMIVQLGISERRACCYARLSRTGYREPVAMTTATQELSARIVELAHQRRRLG